MLQSPSFLFRAERGPKGPWRSYELASRLSYFLWDTMPDTQLFQSAAAGELNTSEGFERKVRRMLRDPRAHQALDEFVSQWLRFDRLLNTYRDRRRYPEFNPELAASMVEESKRLLAKLVWGDRNFMEFFTADYGFLNSDLAAPLRTACPIRRVREGDISAWFGQSRNPWPGCLFDVDEQADRNLAHGARLVHSRAASLSKGSQSSAGYEHEPRSPC